MSKTAILTLRARADEHRRRDHLFDDPCAEEWFEKTEWPNELNRWYSRAIQSKLAFRAHQIDVLLRAQIERIRGPTLTVVELGCGFSSRYHRVGAPARCRWMDVDLPPVIELRNEIGRFGEGHRHAACSVLDPEWLDELDVFDGLGATQPREVVLIAEGLLYYLPRADVDSLFHVLRKRFFGATIIFDVLGELDFKATLYFSRGVGAPVQWRVAPPFPAAMGQFGVEEIAGFELEMLMDGMIERYRRFGAFTHFALKHLSKIRALSDRRGGIIMGRLTPLEDARAKHPT